MINSLLLLESNYSKEEKKIILSFLLHCNKLDLFLIKDPIESKIIKKYKKYIKKDVPVQYLLNTANFLEYNFYVNKNVLIPRPETEQLVIDTNELINKHFPKKANIIDIGTGSGVIAISLKKLNKNNLLTAVDISKKALNVAKKNAKINSVDISFIKSNIYDNVHKKYDVIISNPPYLDDDSYIEDKVLEYEPHLALFGGTKYYEEILKKGKNVLNSKNIIAFEIGDNQKKEINEIIKKYYPQSTIINKKDLNGYDRYIYILNNIE